jgi:hypothetical protein
VMALGSTLNSSSTTSAASDGSGSISFCISSDQIFSYVVMGQP